VISAGSLTRRELSVARLVAVRPAVVLTAIAGGSAALQAYLARGHTGPRFFPDEYIYAAISRSIGHGHLLVRGHAANFPALLQPLLAAPAWRFLPVEQAYHVLQLGNAIAASLVVVPLWLLGRELGLPRWSAYLVCLFSVTLPVLALVPSTVSDFVTYPLAIAGAATAVRSLAQPTRKRQLVFLAFAVLATLGRIQYFVLVPAYLAGAVALDRRAALRRHALAFLAVAPAALGVVLALTGFYAIDFHFFSAATAKMFGLQAFLVSAPLAAAIVPGALAALLRPANRAQVAFAWVTGTTALLLLGEASVWATPDGRFKERYLFAILPLLALAFAVYLRNGRRHLRIVVPVALTLAIAAAWLPLDHYTSNAPLFDSQTVVAAWFLEQKIGVWQASLLIALAIAFGGLLALAATRVRAAGVAALVAAIGLAACALAAAVIVDHSNNLAPPPDPAWVDHAAAGASVTAIVTPSSGRVQMLQKLYWNSSIQRELVLGAGMATDTYPHPAATISRTGALTNVHGDFLFDGTGSQASFWNAAILASHDEFNHGVSDKRFTLFHANGTPRFRLLVENQLSSGWLSPLTHLRAWPASGSGPTGVRFTLSLPATAPHRVRLFVGPERFVLHPGDRMRFACGGTSPVDMFVFSEDASLDRFKRLVTVQMSGLRLARPVQATAKTNCART
jgi:hypothetical protein